MKGLSIVLLIGVVSIAAGCEQSVTSPTPVPFAPGSWNGSFVLGNCDYLNCGFVGQSTVPSQPWLLELTLTGTGVHDVVSGTFRPHIWGPFAGGVPVSGRFVGDTLALSGRTTFPLAGSCFFTPSFGEFLLDTFTARFDRSTNSLRGSFGFRTLKMLSSCDYAPSMRVWSDSLSLYRTGS